MQEQKVMSKQQGRYDGPFRIRSYDEKERKYILETLQGEDLRGGVCGHEALKPVRGEAQSYGKEGEDEENKKYEVTRVEDMRENENGQEYLVKWKGYKERTWEPARDFEAVRAVETYWNRRRREDRRNK